MSEFEKFPKIPRMTSAMQMVITEKMDGTNAQINIFQLPDPSAGFGIMAGSRNRIIKPDDDNYGFATWVDQNREELIAGLGEGRHFGEWCGPGIQKNHYGLESKQLFLFNTLRWHEDNPNPLPCGLETVPVLYKGAFDTQKIDDVMAQLLEEGNSINQGKPEGVIIYLPKSRQLWKRTFEYEEGKWGKK